ncbi:hypothetical protein BLD44_010005 [Mastigocladus laminosus UU774]|nr:hypothetical protein BLD44_010005 [Mastigocladus laminosus UU774]
MARLYIWWNDEKSSVRGVTSDSPAVSLKKSGILSGANDLGMLYVLLSPILGMAIAIPNPQMSKIPSVTQ